MRFLVNRSAVATCGVAISFCVLALGSCGSDPAALWVTPTSQEGMDVTDGSSPGAVFTFTLENRGDSATGLLQAPELGGDDPGSFEVVQDDCSSLTLGPAGTCTFGLRAVASVNGAYKARFAVGDGDITSNVIAVSGTASGFASQTADSWDDVDAGTNHSCGIADGGDLYCWGDASNGRVGNGATTGTVTRALRIGSESDWTDIASGDHHTCGIRGGKLYCWGGDADGELGNGAGSDDVSTPEEIGATLTGDWTHIDAGAVFTCGINDRNTLCWGSNELGSVGNIESGSNTDDVPLPTPVRGSAVSADEAINVWTGGAHACGIIGERFVCWGRNLEGQLGLNHDDPAGRIPWPQDELGVFWTQVALGNNHGCGLRDGELHCWGNNENGQVGNGKDGLAEFEKEPVRIGTSTGWTHVSAGVDHTCGLDAGRLFCWGKNVYGQQAGASGNITTPQQVGASTGWSTFITTGGRHSCAIRDNSLVCWGDNSLGQCGEFFVGVAP